MREIKFRAWHKGGYMIFDCSLNRYGQHSLFGDDTILMQYTGLCDKYGTEIYECDILEICKVERVVVKWDEQIAGFNADIKYADRGWREQVIDHIDTMEVIGNIYKNPKLLEDK